jgi:hypothetical protein
MTAERMTTASEFALTLSEEERSLLLEILEPALRAKHIEAHRTDAIDYKRYVEHEEELLQRLVDKLRRP